MKKIVLISFIIMVLAQWAAPLSMVWKSEQVFSKGKVFRFQTEPVDPEDPLRGRYVALSFTADQYKQNKNDSMLPGGDAYAVIATDSKGYAYIKTLHPSPPDNVNDYVKVRYFFTNDEGVSFLEFPFNEFYMDEYKAPAAENLYRQSMTDSTVNTYALVYIYKGKGITRDLIIHGKSVHSYFK